MIDESTIVCQVCLSVDKSKAYNNQFFYCVTCKMNLCPMCNSTHAKEHVIVDYEKVNLICLKHNSNFEAYCQKCDHNLCLDCEKDHADHKENVALIAKRIMLIIKKMLFISETFSLKMKLLMDN